MKTQLYKFNVDFIIPSLVAIIVDETNAKDARTSAISAAYCQYGGSIRISAEHTIVDYVDPDETDPVRHAHSHGNVWAWWVYKH